MCSYNITLNDTLVEKVRPSFADDQALTLWLQQRIEELLLDFYARQEVRTRARKAILAMRQQSESNGNSELTIEEINEEIRQARQERKKTAAVFYEIALSKEGSFLVTGNQKHFPISPIVVTPAEMLQILQKDNN